MKLKSTVKSLALAPLMVVGLPAAAEVTTYGKIAMTYAALQREADIQLQDNFDVTSNASRIGFKSESKLSESLTVLVKLEYETSVDGEDTDLKPRNSYIGLQGNFGMALVGRHDTLMKLSTAEIDRFNDLPGADIKTVFVGENRFTDIFIYNSPKFAENIWLTASFAPGEGLGTEGGPRNNNGVADYYSAAINYMSDTLYAAAVYETESKNSEVFRLVGEYNFGNAKLAAMYHSAEQVDDDLAGIGKIDGPLGDLRTRYRLVEGNTLTFTDQDGWMISGEYKMGQFKLKAQYAYVETDSQVGTHETTMMVAGVDYKLSDSTKALAFVSDIESDAAEAQFDDSEWLTIAVGIEHKF